jgi:hypothetical protein
MKNAKLWFRFILFMVGMLLLAGLFSCKTPQQKVEKVFSKYVPETKQACVVHYPVKPVTVVTTKYVPGETKAITDTFRVDCDTVKPVEGKKTVECPPSTHQVDTLYIDTSHTYVDTRLVDLQRDTIQSVRATVLRVETKYAEAKKTVFIMAIILFIALILVGGLLYHSLKVKQYDTPRRSY